MLRNIQNSIWALSVYFLLGNPGFVFSQIATVKWIIFEKLRKNQQVQDRVICIPITKSRWRKLALKMKIFVAKFSCSGTLTNSGHIFFNQGWWIISKFGMIIRYVIRCLLRFDRLPTLYFLVNSLQTLKDNATVS